MRPTINFCIYSPSPRILSDCAIASRSRLRYRRRLWEAALQHLAHELRKVERRNGPHFRADQPRPALGKVGCSPRKLRARRSIGCRTKRGNRSRRTSRPICSRQPAFDARTICAGAPAPRVVCAEEVCHRLPACPNSPGCRPRQSGAHCIGRHAGKQCIVLLPKVSGPIRGPFGWNSPDGHHTSHSAVVGMVRSMLTSASS